MGTITKRGELQWQAKVRRKGYPAQSRTFSYKEDAEKWVRELERAADRGGVVDRREAEKNTLGTICGIRGQQCGQPASLHATERCRSQRQRSNNWPSTTNVCRPRPTTNQ